MQGRIQKIQKEGAESLTLPHPEWKLYFSGHAAYSIVGVFVIQRKVKLTFRKKELKSILYRFSKQNRKTAWKYKRKKEGGGTLSLAPPQNPPMLWHGTLFGIQVIQNVMILCSPYHCHGNGPFFTKISSFYVCSCGLLRDKEFIFSEFKTVS